MKNFAILLFITLGAANSVAEPAGTLSKADAIKILHQWYKDSGMSEAEIKAFELNAKKSEAETLLKGIHNSQKIYFSVWEKYTSNLKETGFFPEGKLKYFIAFNPKCFPAEKESVYWPKKYPEKLKAAVNEFLQRQLCRPGGYTAYAVSIKRFGEVLYVDETGSIQETSY